MKSSQLITHILTGAIGIALGLCLAPMIQTKDANVSESPSAKPKDGNTRIAGDTNTESEAKSAIRTRARNREEAPKNYEPHVSLPLKSVIEILKERDFGYSSQFDRLDYSMKKALILLGATATEQEEILKLVEASESEILTAEKKHVKLGEVTPHSIKIDMSGMREPAAEIADRTKDGIRSSLPSDLAEGLISAISWEKFYPDDEKSFTLLEITRSGSGKLTEWEKQDSGGMGGSLDQEFKDDGTPLPAERIFGERWKPFLKGVTILPKDED